MDKEVGLEESYAQDINQLLETFSEKDTIGKQSLSQLFVSDPRAFGSSAIKVLAKSQPSPGIRFLVQLLMKGRLLPSSLLDPRIAEVPEAVAALQAVALNGTKLQPMLELALSKALQDSPGPESRERILRLLDLLAAIVSPNFWNSFQLELMAHSDRIVRSKATLLIGRSGRNVAWIGRRLLDHDGRVQASAVEALWTADAEEARPLLLTASKSKHNRVAANAALGLYRHGESKSVRTLLDMAGHADPAFRISAVWAIAETQDPRFLPFLTEMFKSSQGKLRLAVTRALGSIRRREKANAEAGAIQFQVSQASIAQDGSRRLVFGLSSQPSRHLGSLTVTEFSVWESGELMEGYRLKSSPAPSAFAAGFVAPRFDSNSDPFGLAILAGLERLNAAKRPDDLWRIDRHSLDPEKTDSAEPVEQSFFPYDDSIATQEVKLKHCFISDPEILSKVIAAEVPRERAAPDILKAIERQCDGIAKNSGKKHMFVFLHPKSAPQFDDPARVAPLKDRLVNERIVLHGFSPDPSSDFKAFRELCVSLPDGTFTDAAPDQLPGALESIYLPAVSTGYEITYRVPPGAAAGPVTLKVSCSLGAGQTDLTLQPSGPA
jgi:hypothetical protein